MVVWYADGIIGAAADTMEDENLEEGWRRLGGAFSPPNLSIFFEMTVSARRGSRPAPNRIQS